MENDTLYSRHRKFFMWFSIVSVFGMILCLISMLFLPLGKTRIFVENYSFSKLFGDKPILGLFSFLCIISFLPTALINIFAQKDTWNGKSTLLLTLSTICALVFIVSAICFSEMALEYQDIVLERAVGSYLLWFGLVTHFANIIESSFLWELEKGKKTEDQLFGKK